jgi:enamine deaminase RidA (YjgF/YER057c/UK114 family)
MSIDARLEELGIVLPAPPPLGGNYVQAKTVGNLVFLAGSISLKGDTVLTGTAGVNAGIEEGYEAARCCALLQLAILKRHLGSLDGIAEIVSLNGYVNAAPDFADMPKIVNGATDLFAEIFGAAGLPVRAAIGVSSLPRHALVETQMVVRIV